MLSLILTLLVFCGCQQKSANITLPPPSAEISEPQPAPAVMQEPNIPTAIPIEPNTSKIQSEPNIPQPPATEPNVQKSTVIEPSPAKPDESNSAQAQAIVTVKISPPQFCGICTDFLGKYVDQQGMADYRAISRRKLEVAELLDKFKVLNRSDYNSWSKDEKLAFWINGYNLEFIKIILSNYPIESTRVLRIFWPPNSIRHIKGIWDEYKFIIMEEEFTLREIETRFLLKEFSEPRVIFAIYYGSASGPPLRNEGYCGANLSAQLDDQVKKFLASGQAFKIDRENQKVLLSSIFSPTWYGRQFIGNYSTDMKFKQQTPEVRAVLNFLTKYISPQEVNFLETGNYTIEFMRYDWTLNERAGQ